MPHWALKFAYLTGAIRALHSAGLVEYPTAGDLATLMQQTASGDLFATAGEGPRVRELPLPPDVDKQYFHFTAPPLGPSQDTMNNLGLDYRPPMDTSI